MKLIDGVLHGEGWVLEAKRGVLRRLLLIVAICGALHGAAMGGFAAVMGGASLPILYSAIKVPLLLVVTFALCLPSFYVMNGLLGLHRDFPRVLRALVAMQAGSAIVLASLAPLSLVWYSASDSYTHAVAINGAEFALASGAGQLLLRRSYVELTRHNSRHGTMMWVWLVLYALVGIQMAWVLRPFVGSPSMDVQFWRPEAWSNAYVRVIELILGLFAAAV